MGSGGFPLWFGYCLLFFPSPYLGRETGVVELVSICCVRGLGDFVLFWLRLRYVCSLKWDVVGA